MVIPLGLLLPTGSSDCTRKRACKLLTAYSLGEAASNASLFNLAPDGVCLAMTVTSHPVGSYPTVSPLPRLLDSAWRYIFCCTFRHESVTTLRAWPLTSIMPLWSPDFPLTARLPACQRPSALYEKANQRTCNTSKGRNRISELLTQRLP
jgi:hypothetical protein